MLGKTSCTLWQPCIMCTANQIVSLTIVIHWVVQKLISGTYTSTRSTLTPQGSVALSREVCKQQQQHQIEGIFNLCRKCIEKNNSLQVPVLNTSKVSTVQGFNYLQSVSLWCSVTGNFGNTSKLMTSHVCWIEYSTTELYASYKINLDDKYSLPFKVLFSF